MFLPLPGTGCCDRFFTSTPTAWVLSAKAIFSVSDTVILSFDPTLGERRHRELSLVARPAEPLHSHILNVNVDASVDVIEQIPADVIRVFVHYKIIAAIPAPIGEDWPIPACHFEIEAARKPEPVTVWIDSQEPISEIRTKMIEASMRKWAVQAIHRIVGRVVPIPLIVVDVGRAIYAPVPQSFSTQSSVRASCRGWRR